MNPRPVPELTLRRLPRYYHYLCRLRDAGQEMVSAAQIGEELGVHHTQVRKDLSATGSIGKPKVGHRIADLVLSIEAFLHWDNRSEAFLVGVGNLGAALLGYNGFERAGIKIVAAFDADVKKVGTKIHGVGVLPMEKLEGLAKRMHIPIGVITVPADKAQDVANTMIRAGMKAIWNFAPITLSVPPDLIVENVELYSSLAVFSRKLAELPQD